MPDNVRLVFQRLLLSLLFFVLAKPGASFAAVEWKQQAGYREASVKFPAEGSPGFREINFITTGIIFTNRLAEERSLTNQIFLNGSGVAAGDIDGDGLCDLYFCGLDSPNALYRNLGDWHFADVTAAAGVACADQASTGASFADVDGDGDLDLLVNGIARGTRLFLNDGHGIFREATDPAGLRGSTGSASMALADIDGDGWLDLYVVNYRNDTMRDMPNIQFAVGVTNGIQRLLSVNGRSANAPELIGRFTFSNDGGVLENGEADVLFRNVGQGRFERVSWTNGAFLNENGMPAQIPYDWGLSAMFRDIDGDGAPDLYVCNDFQSPDRIWINDGRGKFRAIDRSAIRQTSLFSMGVDFADIDRDGYDDFLVADMLSRDHSRRQVQVMDAAAFRQVRMTTTDRPQIARNTLFRNRGNGTFAEIAQLSGLEASDWSWCPAFLDVDLDGFEDLLLSTGHWRDAQNADITRELDKAAQQQKLSPAEQLDLRRRFPRLDTPNAAFRNRGDLTFDDVSTLWGFASRRIGQGMALADLDNDGDLDVIINCLNDAPLLLRNDASAPRIAVRLRGQAPNTRGIGAKVRVTAPGLPPQSQEFICGGRYLSSDDPLRTFAAGSPTNRLTIEVMWRRGARTVLRNVPANALYEIDEAGAEKYDAQNHPTTIPRENQSLTNPSPLAPRPFFQNISPLLQHQHADQPYDDFALQPLLPRKLSELGPGVSWFDFNSDGWDDLFIGSGRGGRLGVFRNNGQGGFVRQKATAFETPIERDITTVLGWQPNATNLVLLMGLANYEDANPNAPALREFSIVSGKSDDALLRTSSSAGPLCLADFDGDGDLDLFVGGRVRAGRYPEPTSSALLRNEAGRLRHDMEASRVFENVGLISGAVFTDLDGDGRPDLALACDWGPLRVFRNEQGKFTNWNAPLRWTEASTRNSSLSSLNALTGCWNSIAAGDFDADGRLDLVAGNWGRNTAHQRFLAQPIRIAYGETDGSGTLASIEAHFDTGLNKIVPRRDWGVLSAAIPLLQDRFSSFTAFSTAGLSDVLSAGLPRMQEVAAAFLDSVVLLNRGDFFEARPLPIEAQFSPVFGIAVGDLDGDGNEDLALAQNFFGVSTTDSRHDAGCGLWLRGDGAGNFRTVGPQESGISIDGEGRGLALCDFDHDGRLDCVVGQHRGLTQLFRNLGARPGLRIHPQGSEQNPKAVGSNMRIVYRGEHFGPVHEVRLGGGYWSQDSSDVILGMKDNPEALEIRWPSGVVQRLPITEGVRELSPKMP